MSRLQGRVASRFGMAPQQQQAEKPVDVAIRESAQILHPILARSLYPQRFTGSIAISVHVQDGRVYHIKEHEQSKIVPGAIVGLGAGRVGIASIPPAAVSTASGADASPDVDHTENILDSAMRDLRTQLTTALVPNYYGIILLTLSLDSGMCTLVTCDRDRIYRKAVPRT